MIGFGSNKDERGAEREREWKERWRPQGSRLPACGHVEGGRVSGFVGTTMLL